jgi:hypothetical protein
MFFIPSFMKVISVYNVDWYLNVVTDMRNSQTGMWTKNAVPSEFYKVSNNIGYIINKINSGKQANVVVFILQCCNNCWD